MEAKSGHDHSWAQDMDEATALCPDLNPELAGTGIRCPGDGDRPGANCEACWHVWSLHGPGGCAAKVYPTHSLTGEPCPCEHATEAAK